MDDDYDRSAVHQWELRLLIAAFTGWAAVIAAYGQAAVNRIDRMVAQMEKERIENAALHAQIERRLTIVEKDGSAAFREIERLEGRMERQELHQ